MNKRQRKKYPYFLCSHMKIRSIYPVPMATCGRNGKECRYCECRKYEVPPRTKRNILIAIKPYRP